MQLVSFSVRNFRSISEASKLPISRKTILIGPNNEGKSNLLDALNTGMSVIATYARMSRFRDPSARRMYRSIYDWDSDFPINLQESKPKGQSVTKACIDKATGLSYWL
jgi:putative ATP-dependent endonuclease of the OLD family